MIKTIKFNPDRTRAVLYEYSETKPLPTEKKTKSLHDNDVRTSSVHGSASYERSLRRAFNSAKLLAFFNPDLTRFLTFTYRENVTDVEKALHDLKMMIKHHNRNSNKPLKYIFVFELQKRGAIHIHMIANDALKTRKNKHGYEEIEYWHDRHGFTNVRKLENTDGNFKPYLYLFKYMHKSTRIGKSFIHTSRNLNRPTVDNGHLYPVTISKAKICHTEQSDVEIDGEVLYTVTKHYLDLSSENTWQADERLVDTVHTLFRNPA